jgi:hypothetical protein
MARPDMTLSVVGGIHPNADGSNRLFEIALCAPGEPIDLGPEPQNKHDPSAVAVFSCRGVQIGYLSAERCGWIGARMRNGDDVRGIFQASATGGALIRVSFTGSDPVLPIIEPRQAPPVAAMSEDGFYPDEIPPDDFPVIDD